jgi:hypothetical protein
VTRPSPPTSADLLRVSQAIQRAAGKAVSRMDLVAATGLCDRTLRECVSELVRQGESIVTDRTLGGYRLATDPALIRRECEALRSHGTRLLERANALERATAPEQIELFG